MHFSPHSLKFKPISTCAVVVLGNFTLATVKDPSPSLHVRAPCFLTHPPVVSLKSQLPRDQVRTRAGTCTQTCSGLTDHSFNLRHSSHSCHTIHLEPDADLILVVHIACVEDVSGYHSGYTTPSAARPRTGPP
ncbi:hypothetical protein TIFTF001_018891 [Ficus carica]|uniref:Uncharacterized protein n=1 Tax=Ficus carica TaxID=3494 RepID=A0AA88DB59_FICCA|nr:hypothetical protein TIFTF001_018891 [Ficus carica]